MKALRSVSRTDGTGVSLKKAQKFRLKSASLTMSTPLPEAHYGKKWLLVLVFVGRKEEPRSVGGSG